MLKRMLIEKGWRRKKLMKRQDRRRLLRSTRRPIELSKKDWPWKSNKGLKRRRRDSLDFKNRILMNKNWRDRVNNRMCLVSRNWMIRVSN